ncbi:MULTISPECIES: hypothetical protein [unclassified Pseudarthrobacter]|uniref:hypothetical protein n=1 Tax=unclassified Pseudarthrobacter TaxID=2647000 RepID=UPI003645137E
MGGKTAIPQTAPEQASQNQPSRTLKVSFDFNSCLEVAGTTTFAADAVAALADREGIGELGYFEGQAKLQRDPGNPVDRQAIAVLVDGEKVGCLPSYAAKDFPLPIGASHPVPYQLHVAAGKKLLAKAYIWMGGASRSGPTRGRIRRH